jgi:hypothetical protein
MELDTMNKLNNEYFNKTIKNEVYYFDKIINIIMTITIITLICSIFIDIYNGTISEIVRNMSKIQ